MDPNKEFIIDMAIKIKALYDANSQTKKNSLRKALQFDGASHAIPKEIEQIHRMFEKNFGKEYLDQKKLYNKNPSQYEVLALEVLDSLMHARAEKIEPSTNKKVKESYNDILQLRDQYMQPKPKSKP